MAAPKKKIAKTAQRGKVELAGRVPMCPECAKPMVATMVVNRRRRMRWKCTCGVYVPIRH